MIEPSDIRWEQRLNNFTRALTLLREVLEGEAPLDELSNLEKEGTVQRFIYTFELAWKTLKDKMEFDGLTLERLSPKFVFKTAHQAKYLDHLEDWLEMANDRNLMSHKYDYNVFDQVLTSVAKTYHPRLEELHDNLLSKKFAA